MKKIIYWVILLSPLSTVSITRASHIDFKLLVSNQAEEEINNQKEERVDQFLDTIAENVKPVMRHKKGNDSTYWIRFSREMLENNGMRNNTIPIMQLNSLVLSALSSHLNKYSLTTEILRFDAEIDEWKAEKNSKISLTLTKSTDPNKQQNLYFIGIGTKDKKDSSHTLAYLTVVGLVIMAIGLQQLASKRTTKQHTNSKPQEGAETKKESV